MIFNALLALFLLVLAAPLSALDDGRFYDYAAYQAARQILANGDQTQNFGSAYYTQLNYHLRRWDPDSILTAATALLNVRDLQPRHRLDGLHAKTHALLALYQLEDHRAAVTNLREARAELSPELVPLADTYLLIQEGRYELYHAKNYERAAVCFANAMHNERLSRDQRLRVLYDLIRTLNRMGQFEAAHLVLKKYQATHQDVLKDELDELILLLIRASFNQDVERHDHAANLSKRLIERLKPYQQQLPYLTARAHQMAGDARYAHIRDEETLAYVTQAIALRDLPEFYESLVATLYHMGRYDEAIAYCQQVLMRDLTGYQPTSVVDVPAADAVISQGMSTEVFLMWKARALYKKSIELPDAEAIPLLEAAIASGERGRQYNNRKLFAADGFVISQMIINHESLYGIGYQMRAAYQLVERRGRPHDYRTLFRYVEMSKNFMLTEAFSVEYLPEPLRRERKKRLREFEQAEYAVTRAIEQRDTSLETKALRAMRALEATLRDHSARYPLPITEHAEVHYADPYILQVGLAEGQAIVQYASQWNHHYVFVITPKKILAQKIGDTHLLDENVKGYVKRLQSPLAVQHMQRNKLIRESRELYDFLFQPIREALEGIDRLIIIPEHDLSQLPFETLLSPTEPLPFEDLPWLLHDYEISYHFSGTLYERHRRRQGVSDGSFIGFAPVFEDDNSLAHNSAADRVFVPSRHRGVHRGGFSELPGTEREINAIADLLRPVSSSPPKLLLREAATSQALEQVLEQPVQFLHIATHGLTNPYDPRLSAFACFNDTQQPEQAFVFARQIEYFDVRADLAVLSSCESGLGRIIAGENMMAFNRSFLLAGAKNILSTLWRIDDASSSDFMIEFYRQYLERGSYASALRAAKIKLLGEPRTAAPRHWAAFGLVGE